MALKLRWTSKLQDFEAFEAIENLSTQGDEKVLGALKYMLLCKVVLNMVSFHFVLMLSEYQLADVNSPLTIKLALNCER